MKCIKWILASGLFVFILFMSLVSLEASVSAGKVDLLSAPAFKGRYSYMVCQTGSHGLVDLEQQDLKLDWVRRADPVYQLKHSDKDLELKYTFQGKSYTLDEYFKRNNVLGFLALHQNQILVEKYFNNAGPASKFISNSMAKSIVSVLTGIAIDEGIIGNVNDPVVRYLPYLSKSGFAQATIKNLLQMAAGVKWNEDYMAPDSDFPLLLQSWIEGSPSFSELAASLKSSKSPGAQFEYQSISTQVLVLVLESATGMPLNEYCGKKLWSGLGAESDAFYYRGNSQAQISSSVGFAATLRDYGRFGLMVMNGGGLNGHRIVSNEWILESTTPKGAIELPRPLAVNDNFSETLGYAYQWWLLEGGVFMAMGIYGQAIYIDPSRHVVIVQSSAWQEPDPDEKWDEMIAVMNALAEEASPQKNYMCQVWDDNYPFYEKIFNLPFNRELLAGNLDEQLFRNYIVQDYLFLQNFRKVYGILLSKAPDNTATDIIKGLLESLDEEIQSVHTRYLAKWGVSNDDLLTMEPLPETELYNSFLIKTATLDPFEVGLMAVIPCHWIYYQIGKDMKSVSINKANKYQQWIDEYSGETWEKSQVKILSDYGNVLMLAGSESNRKKMKEVFAKAMKLEYMFWDGIYKGGRWPQ